MPASRKLAKTVDVEIVDPERLAVRAGDERRAAAAALEARGLLRKGGGETMVG